MLPDLYYRQGRVRNEWRNEKNEMISAQKSGVHDFYAQIARLPEVEQSGLVAGMPLSRVDSRDTGSSLWGSARSL